MGKEVSVQNSMQMPSFYIEEYIIMLQANMQQLYYLSDKHGVTKSTSLFSLSKLSTCCNSKRCVGSINKRE